MKTNLQKKSRPQHPRHTSGFTLVEMLIVIAVIGLLAALLLPVLGRVREKARATACVSNLKQLGMAFQLYSQDYNRRYPGSGDFNTWRAGGGQWVSGIQATNNMTGEPGTLAKVSAPIGEYIPGRTANVEEGAIWSYVKSAGVYFCPSNADGRNKGLSYSMNCAVTFINDVRIRQPAEIVLLVDEDKNNDGFFYAVDNDPLPNPSGAPGTSTDELTQLHNGGGNLLFCDGHAKFYPFDAFPLDANAEGQANKWRQTGIPRFHDKTFGPKGSYFKSGATMDYCFAPPVAPATTF